MLFIDGAKRRRVFLKPWQVCRTLVLGTREPLLPPKPPAPSSRRKINPGFLGEAPSCTLDFSVLQPASGSFSPNPRRVFPAHPGTPPSVKTLPSIRRRQIPVYDSYSQQ